jgi:nucleotide-binding universal stress UspA family protein
MTAALSPLSGSASLFSPGDVIDGFHFVERLHMGGMSEIWKVTREDMAPPAVFKAPLIGHAEEAAAQEAATIVGFEMEQMILPLIRGPHAPHFIAAGDFSRRPYLVMELIEGESLLRRVDHVPLPVAEVAKIGRGVALALSALHAQNVLHLDVKPSNIMRRASGDYALIDFGLSRHEQLPDLLAEEFHVPFGTAPYLSPEQVLRDRGDPRSDIFSLGVTLYYLLTGVRPFGYPRSRTALAKRLWRDPEPPRRLRPDCPAWLQEVILHCLEPEADQRYGSAAQLALDLAAPEQIALTARAEKLRTDSIFAARRRWWTQKFAPSRWTRSMAARRALAPIVVAAVDFAGGPAGGDLLRENIRRILLATPGARLACVTVIQTPRPRHDDRESGGRLHVRRLVELRRWAANLGLADNTVTAHVLEADDTAEALLDFARRNHVDHLVLCASAPNAFWPSALGPVAERVVAQAPCTVTLARAAQADSRLGAATEPGEGLGL